jgi:hypothetical protein
LRPNFGPDYEPTKTALLIIAWGGDGKPINRSLT